LPIRIYELACELEVPSRDLIKFACDWGVKVSNHFSTLTKKQIDTIKTKHEITRRVVSPSKEDQLSKEEMIAQIQGASNLRREKKEKKKKGSKTLEDAPEALTSEELVKQFRKIYKSDSNEGAAGVASKKKKTKEIFTFDKNLTSHSKNKKHNKRSPLPANKTVKEESEEVLEPEVSKIPDEPKEILLSLPITLKSLSAAMGVKVSEIMGSLLKKGQMLNQNASLSKELAMEISIDYGILLEVEEDKDIEDDLKEMLSSKASEKNMEERPPVITFMGHVDHGKTSLLDRIRASSKAGTEAGGITQHIAAYQVETSHGQITFLDTPGHEAFTNMRARGANATDLVVLVVAADDGIMPQTVEAVNHAKAADVPIIVAINKIDLPGANVEKVKSQLANMELTPEDWGGSTSCVGVSALTGEGVDDLLEMLALEGEILELKADSNCTAHGIVLESRVDPGRGIICSVLIQEGCLNKGDVILCSHGYGRVRFLYDHENKQIKKATASVPVELAGLSELPEAGDTFYVLDSISKAKEIADKRSAMQRELMHTQEKASLHSLIQKIEAGKVSQIKVVLKADVAGSLEVIERLLGECQTEEVKVNIIHKAVGAITENDIKLAASSSAIVIGFHVIADTRIKASAEQFGVDLRIYNVIYHLKDDVLDALEGALGYEEREVVTGHIEIRKVFKSSKIGNIAGCFVLDGTINRNNGLRITRDGIVLYEGKIGSLKRNNDDVKEVREKFECGIVIRGFDDIQENDIIETFMREDVKRTLDRSKIGKPSNVEKVSE